MVKIELIENKNYDEERALYNIKDTEVKDCIFAGPQDGESILLHNMNQDLLMTLFGNYKKIFGFHYGIFL